MNKLERIDAGFELGNRTLFRRRRTLAGTLLRIAAACALLALVLYGLAAWAPLLSAG